MSNPLYHRKHSDYQSELDIDELLSKLNDEDIALLQQQIDPDDPFLPPSERCPSQTDKDPTGPLNRKKLMQYLEEKGATEKDWEEQVAFVKKEIRSKWNEPKKHEKIDISDISGGTKTDYDDALVHATEDELVSLAAVLGFHGIITNEQYNSAGLDKFATDGDTKVGGFNAMARATQYKALPDEKPNDTNVNEAIKSIAANDAALPAVNFNNIKLSYDEFEQVFEGVRKNGKLERLEMAATGLTDLPAQWLIESLPDNKGMTCLNLESNFVTPTRTVDIIRAALLNPTITEIKLANQSYTTLGVRAEQAIAELVEGNQRLLKLGLSIDSAGARNRVERALERNMDLVRQKRAK